MSRTGTPATAPAALRKIDARQRLGPALLLGPVLFQRHLGLGRVCVRLLGAPPPCARPRPPAGPGARRTRHSPPQSLSLLSVLLWPRHFPPPPRQGTGGVPLRGRPLRRTGRGAGAAWGAPS